MTSPCLYCEEKTLNDNKVCSPCQFVKVIKTKKDHRPKDGPSPPSKDVVASSREAGRSSRLIYDKLPKNVSCFSSSSKTIPVICYDDGSNWVVPNPRDQEQLQRFERLYNKSFYVRKKVWFVTEEDLANPEVWQ